MGAEPRRLVICNPRARRTRGHSAAETVRELLAARGMAAEVETCASWKAARDRARQAAESGYDHVIAAGGDGTVNAVANGLATTRTALGILPLGTGNVLAYNLGISRLDRALDTLARGRPAAMDLGWAGDRYFVAIAGVGFDAQVCQSVDPNWQQQIGRFAFVVQGLVTRFSQTSRHFKVTLTGKRQVTLQEPMWSALVCNVPQSTWNLPVAPAASPSDGLLDLILIRDANVWQFLNGVGNALFWELDMTELPGVSHHRVKSVHIETDPPWLWETDGDPGGETPVYLEVRPRALRILAPDN